MPPLVLVFPMLAFILLLSIASFHFKNLFLSPSIVSLIRTTLSTYSNSLSAPSLANSVATTTTTPKRKGDSTDPWCIPTFASNSDNSASTLTPVFAQSFRLTNLTKASGIPFFRIAHCNTFLYSVKSFLYVYKAHIQLFSFSIILFLQPSLDKHSINSSSLMHNAKLHFISTHYYKKPFLATVSTTFIPCSTSFTSL